MKRQLTRLLITICLLTAGGLNSIAQEKEPRPDDPKPTKRAQVAPAPQPPQVEPKPMLDGVFALVSPKTFFGKVVKGAPYSATAVTETIQTLSDGNQIIRKNESKFYRDSEGRLRVEQSLETIGKWAALYGKAQQSIFISDPVAGVSYSLDERARVAQKNVTPVKRPAAIEPSRTYKIGDQAVTKEEFDAFTASSVKKPRPEGEPVAKPVQPNDPETPKRRPSEAGVPDPGQRKTESLGDQMIEGLMAEGTRATLTLSPGEIGNTLPINIVDERWYSPELQLVVMAKHHDPRSGDVTYRLTNVNRSEPDRALFEVPADYAVVESKPAPPKPTPTPMRREQ